MNHIRKLASSCASKGYRNVLRHQSLQKLARCMCTVENPPSMKTSTEFTIPQGILGQPTCHTHPHLVQQGHLTYGITQMEYKERREVLVNKLVAEVEGNLYKNHIIVIPAACKQYMSDKIPYVFRQNSDFFYLTGCLEPSAVLVLVKPIQTEAYKSYLFVHEKDSHAEMWEGPRTGCSAAAALFAVDEARPIENFSTFLQKTAYSSKPSILWYHDAAPANPDLHSTVRSALGDGIALDDPQRTLHHMRVVKSPAEVQLMRDACHIGSQAVNMAIACTKPGVSEHTISAVLEFSSRTGGAQHLAFPPVVAGGARATHIHYICNDQLLRHGEMLLVDAGCQRWLYNSDISRTWPVSGKFSKHHRILYELVLAVQKRLIQLLGEHRPPLDQLFDTMCRLLGTHLQQEGILPRDIDTHQLVSLAYRLCPHHVSHYLGLDVHDAPLVRRSGPVRTGMVVTVEPGIYIRPDDLTVPAEFRGVGIRIEDDVLVTDGEPEVLTHSCVKEVDDIEAVVGKHTAGD